MASADGEWEDEGATHHVDDEVPSVGTVEEGLEGVEFLESDRPMLAALVNDLIMLVEDYLRISLFRAASLNRSSETIGKMC